MYLVLSLVSFLCICATSHTKIYDCFPFFNEIELLQVRLAELNDQVDYFVLVESVETQRGDSKPLYFQDNQHLFEKYLHKIIHVVNEESITSNLITDHRGYHWDREIFQRECIKRGLQNCNDSDIILISDLDEIPRFKILSKIEHLLYKHSEKQNFSVALEMPLFIFQLNRKAKLHGGAWVGTVATLYKNVKDKGIQFFRENRCSSHRILNGGWHFTWMGGKDKIRQKFLSVVEGKKREEVDLISDEELEAQIQVNPVIRINSPYPNDFPKYVIENIDYFRSIGFVSG